MKRIAITAVCAAAFAVTSSGAFAAKKQCPIVGTWKDSLGTTATFTSQKAGTGTNTSFCSGTYAIKVTKLTTAIFDIKAVPPNKSCPKVSAKLMFVGGCTSASGTVTVQGVGNVNDTFNKTGEAIVRRSPLETSALNEGLK